MTKPCLIVVCGPTAIGKTSLSISLAKELKAEVFSADSRQFYKEMEIGTAKPNSEELAAVKHHYISNKSIREEYNASDFEKDILRDLECYFKTNDIAILCGGSGLYLNAVTEGFDSELPGSSQEIRKQLKEDLERYGLSFLQEKLQKLDPGFYPQVDPHNSKRLMRALEICLLTGKSNLDIRKGEKKKRDFEIIKIGLDMKRHLLYERINRRVDFMMQDGLLDEVKSLLDYREKNALKTVGYSELFKHLDQQLSLEEAVEKIKVNSRRYAKRQLTWFKKDSEIRWFHPQEKLELLTYIRSRRNTGEPNRRNT